MNTIQTLGTIVKLNSYNRLAPSGTEYTIREVTILRDEDKKLLTWRVNEDSYKVACEIGQGNRIAIETTLEPDKVTDRVLTRSQVGYPQE